MSAWQPPPLVIATLLAVTLTWARGRRRLARGARAAPGRAGRPAAFLAGMLTLAVALASPLDALAGTLLVAHMTQHMLLIMVAAPLLVLGAPGVPMLLALPPRWRRRLGAWRRRWPVVAVRRLAAAPVAVWALHVGALWLWHLPGPYRAALHSDALHALEHASFLGTAWLLWRLVISPSPRHRLAPGEAMLAVFLTAVPTNLLGALLTFAPAPLYDGQSTGAAARGLTSLEDQQLAGIVMWVPADAVYLAVLCTLLFAWLGSAERDTPSPGGVAGRG